MSNTTETVNWEQRWHTPTEGQTDEHDESKKRSFRNCANSSKNYLKECLGKTWDLTRRRSCIVNDDVNKFTSWGCWHSCKEKCLSQIQSSMFTNPNILFWKCYFIPNVEYSENVHIVIPFECFHSHITWLSWKGTSKVLSIYAIKEYRGNTGIPPFWTSTINGGDGSTSRSGWFTHGKQPWYLLNRRLREPQKRSVHFWKGKIPCGTRDSYPSSSVLYDGRTESHEQQFFVK